MVKDTSFTSISTRSAEAVADACENDRKDISFSSCSSTSTTSAEQVSVAFRDDEKDQPFESILEVSIDTEEAQEDGPGRETIILEMNSFSSNPTMSESKVSLSTSVSPTLLPPDIISVKPPRRYCHHRRCQHSGNRSRTMEDPKSSPYAQLCFDPQQKTLVTMLETNGINGKIRRPRLPLDMPTPDDFPWLHEPSSSWTSSSSPEGVKHSKSLTREDYCEPIVLSGPWMLEDSMTNDEADIYWLLRDTEDVWVTFDDGCGKVFKKVWTCCINGQWKLKRAPFRNQTWSPDSRTDAREEKRFRYSVLS